MKSLLLLITLFACVARGHEIHGLFSRNGSNSDAPRTRIPFDSFKKVANGRVYTLWMAPNGAFVFYLEKPWESVKLDLTKADPRFRIWFVETKKNLTLPEGFKDLEPDKKGGVAGVEELTGTVHLVWKSESDYTMNLDVKGAMGHCAFKGYLFGGRSNIPPKDVQKPAKSPK